MRRGETGNKAKNIHLKLLKLAIFGNKISHQIENHS